MDPKGLDFGFYKKAFLLKPNLSEFEAVVGISKNIKEFNGEHILTEEMINKCSKRKFFFDHNRRLTRSKRSRVPKGSREGSDPIRSAIFSEDDDDFIDFVEVSSVKVVNLLSLLVSSYLSCFTLLLYNRLFVCFRRNA